MSLTSAHMTYGFVRLEAFIYVRTVIASSDWSAVITNEVIVAVSPLHWSRQKSIWKTQGVCSMK